MKDKVSIVVPVYNQEKLIYRCIDSLLAQTYKNIEILLVNDGSKDKSLEILKEYQKKYKTIIKVYSHENSGASFTRNKGLKLATGKFITFIDSDDYVDNDYIEKLMKNIKKYDCVFCGHRKVDESGKVLSINKLDNSEWSKFKYNATWGKLYNLEYLKKKEISYPKYKIGEDLCFNILTIMSNARINTINYCGYNYVQNKSSVTNTVKKKYDILSVLQELQEEINCNEKYMNCLYHFYIKTVLFSLILQRKILTSKEMNEEYNKAIKWIISIGGKLKGFNYSIEAIYSRIIVNMFIIGYYLKLNRLNFFLIKKLY